MGMRFVSLATALFVFWLALSGHYTLFLVVSGAGCALAVALVAVRVRSFDQEGVPIEFIPGAFTYIPWLVWEILKSAWAVSKIIVDPRLPISPTMTIVKASQRTSTGIAIYANSITLTPGTITVGVDGNDLTVHALVGGGADDLEAGGMDRRVSRFEGTA
jgi:multicomponent Na+:H+ antiporter subunit E